MNPEQHSKSEARFVAGGGLIFPPESGRPLTRMFKALSLVWLFPSSGAVLILCITDRNFEGARGFLGHLARVPVEDWTAAGLLLAHAVFGALAWHYSRTEQEVKAPPFAERAAPLPAPPRDPRNLY